jgi:NUMOD4 motif/HNH endonuclease
MIIPYPNEEFKEIEMPESLTLRYAISNFGRLISFSKKIEDGRALKGSLTDGYRVLRYHINEEGNRINYHHFFYKLVAQYFLKKTSEDQVHVLHLDRDRSNDVVSNLQWATKQEFLDHCRKSPYVIEAKKKLVEHIIKSNGAKLTTTKVMFIKKWLQEPEQKTRLKIIAKQFGVTPEHLRMIKNGERWGHIKV